MIGVVYDKAVGKHDGKMKNKRYFRCEEKHGVLEKASNFSSVGNDNFSKNNQRSRISRIEIPGTRYQVYKEKMRQSYLKSSNEAPYNDVTFLIGKSESKFCAMRAPFAIFSDVFESMFYGNFSEGQRRTSVNKEKIQGQKNGKNIVNRTGNSNDNGNGNGNSVIRIPDISVDAFLFLRDYVYGLEPIIDESNVINILYLSIKYMIKCIENDCMLFIAKNSWKSTKQVVSLLLQLYNYGLYDLMDELLNLISQDLVRKLFNDFIQSTKELFKLPAKVVSILISNDQFGTSEESIYEFCQTYVVHFLARKQQKLNQINKAREEASAASTAQQENETKKEQSRSDCRPTYSRIKTPKQSDLEKTLLHQNSQNKLNIAQNAIECLRYFKYDIRYRLMDIEYFKAHILSTKILSQQEYDYILKHFEENKNKNKTEKNENENESEYENENFQLLLNNRMRTYRYPLDESTIGLRIDEFTKMFKLVPNAFKLQWNLKYYGCYDETNGQIDGNTSGGNSSDNEHEHEHLSDMENGIDNGDENRTGNGSVRRNRRPRLGSDVNGTYDSEVDHGNCHMDDSYDNFTFSYNRSRADKNYFSDNNDNINNRYNSDSFSDDEENGDHNNDEMQDLEDESKEQMGPDEKNKNKSKRKRKSDANKLDEFSESDRFLTNNSTIVLLFIENGSIFGGYADSSEITKSFADSLLFELSTMKRKKSFLFGLRNNNKTQSFQCNFSKNKNIRFTINKNHCGNVNINDLKFENEKSKENTLLKLYGKNTNDFIVKKYEIWELCKDPRQTHSHGHNHTHTHQKRSRKTKRVT